MPVNRNEPAIAELPFTQVATKTHVAAATDAIKELCSILTTQDSKSEGNSRHFRFSHFDHGHFLNEVLYGFPVMGTAGKFSAHRRLDLDRVTEEKIEERWCSVGLQDHLDTAKSRVGLELWSVDQTTEQSPFTYAIVVNSPVERQIEVCLSAIESTLSRAEVSAKFLASSDMAELDQDTRHSDASTKQHVMDEVRMFGWRTAAEGVRRRAEAAGTPLVVTFSNPIFGPSELALRAPALRRVYNEMPVIRRAVDVVATLLSRGLTLRGNASESSMRKILDTMDTSAMRSYLAHLARDAFVCGNGYLSFGEMPDSDIRLLKPDNARLCDDPSSVLDVATGRRTSVLHVTGADQLDSVYGVGQLEPFVALVGQHDVLVAHLYVADASLFSPAAPQQVKTWAEQSRLAIETMAAGVRSRIRESLGKVTDTFADPPPDLYFPQLQLMDDSAPFFLMGSSESSDSAGAHS